MKDDLREAATDDGPCTSCDNTGWCFQTERPCQCSEGIALKRENQRMAAMSEDKTELRDIVAQAIADANGSPHVEDWLLDADAAIAAARPVIGEECAKVAEDDRHLWGAAGGVGNAVLLAEPSTIASAIRSATQV